MSHNRCLICLESVADGDYHPSCQKTLFGTEEPPGLEIDAGRLRELAKQAVRERVTVPGVQAKLSAHIRQAAGETPKLTIVGLWGGFILKPPSERWQELPANEHATLRMAEAAGIETAANGLVRLSSGEPVLVSRRMDRILDDDGSMKKLAMEDMCQLTGRLTEDKYKGSHEQIGKIIKTYTSNPVFDVVRFFEWVIFSYLTGNGDMHLKNFSLLRDPALGWRLAPAYDLLCTRLVIPESADPDQLALTLAGKRSHFSAEVFRQAGNTMGLTQKQVDNVIDGLLEKIPAMERIIESSFLSDEMKDLYNGVLQSRIRQM